MARRFAYVDLIRGLCALAVLVCHYQWFYASVPGSPPPPFETFPLYSVLWPLFEYGGLAVQMFWLLSGFVFAVAYASRDITAREFFVHRVARLYPLHLATLILMAILQAISMERFGHWTAYGNNDLAHFAQQLFFASNWLTLDHSFNGPIWSVSIEVLIYFVFLAYVQMGAGLARAMAFGVIFSIAAPLTDSLITYCGALFFLGVVMGELAPMVKGRLKLALAAVVIAVIVVSAVDANLVPLAIMFALAPAILVAFIAMDLNLRPLPERWHWVGAITYAVYLLHMPVLIAIRLVSSDNLPLNSPLMLGAFVALVIGLAIPTHRYFERPAQRLVLRWGKKRLKPPPKCWNVANVADGPT